MTRNRPEIESMPDRETILASVRFGRISPSMAEKWISHMGHPPVQPLGNIATFDPMQEQEWTLPMAAAWFIWRSVEAVREQWIAFRRCWLASAEPSNLKALTEVSLRELFAWADLGRFQIRPNRKYGMTRKLFHNPQYHSPVYRLEAALESQQLNLTGISFHQHTRLPIRPPHLAGHIEYAMKGGEVSGPRTFLFVDGRPGTSRFTDLHVYRNEVISADEVASQAVFDEPHWTFEHVLGWIAHRDPRRFRLIAPIDSASPSESPRDDWKMTYAFDFVDQDPEGTLREAFLQGQLDGELDRRFLPRGFPNPIPINWWRDGAMTKVPRMWFRRDQVINLWPPISLTRIRSESIAATETDAPQAPKLRAYSELPKMQARTIDIARDLWNNKNNIPPIVEERDRQISAKYLDRRLSTKAPNPRTIRRAFQATDKSNEWEPWTKG